MEEKGKQTFPFSSNSERLSPKTLSLCSTAEARSLLPYADAKRLQVLPLGIVNCAGKETVSVACSNSADRELVSLLRFALTKDVRLIQLESALLAEAIFIAYHGDEQALSSSVERLKGFEARGAEQDISQADVFRNTSGEPARFLVALVDYAISRGASDLHLSPERVGASAKLRINGEMLCNSMPLCTLKSHQELINRLKILAQLDISEKRLPQDGSFAIELAKESAHIRLSIMPTIHGEKAVLRFSAKQQLIKLSNLGFDERTYCSVREILDSQQGSIIFAGPTGGGKTSSMYAIMNELAKTNLSRVSIEDPVEIHLSGVGQTSINAKIGLDYPKCLRAVLRQDPDVILLGEMRDADSAQTALQAAITGHLLLSSLHARSVFDVLIRLGHLGLDCLTLSQAINLLIWQRLIPGLCSQCKELDPKSSDTCAHAVYKAVGCRACDYSGHAGRLLLLESLTIDDTVEKTIREKRFSKEDLKQRCTLNNYTDPQTALLNYFAEGKISMLELSRYVRPTIAP